MYRDIVEHANIIPASVGIFKPQLGSSVGRKYFGYNVLSLSKHAYEHNVLRIQLPTCLYSFPPTLDTPLISCASEAEAFLCLELSRIG